MAFPRVLIIDDDRWLIATLEREMREREREWHLVATCDAAMARAVVCSGDVDVLVTDLHMPDIDGEELVRCARRHRRHIAIILITASDADDALVRNVDDIIYKPFLPSALDAMIASYVPRGI